MRQNLAPLTDLTPGRLRAWHTVLAASLAADLPGEPVPTLAEETARLTAPTLASRRLLWVDADRGIAALRLFGDPGQEHLADLDLHVHPAHRRRGVGSDLLAAVLAAARAEHRRTVMTEVTAGTPADRFLAARGFRPGLALTWLRLPLDLPVTEAGARPGYHLERWHGVVPEHLTDSLVAAKRAMADMPVGELDYGTVHWDAAKVRAMAEVVARRGEDLYTVAAVSDSGGGIAGFTEVVVPATGPALQYDTVVAPGHRGRGLGRWVKTEMVAVLRERHPDLTAIETNNADDNEHMLAVNLALGWELVKRSILYQVRVD